ncbi:tetratricopeptide repeat protein [Anaerosinus massiliensis]|uniref:tetratricopeptide repeat protein n=1 Tax=Massilibacillus massiliensis TaxID=1806837 RepID=UPI000ADDA4DE|nr:tetratricopeptide repeat protein [Massilibacillus massiliensis]
MKTTMRRMVVFLLLLSLILTGLPQVQAVNISKDTLKKIDKDDLKKVAAIGAAAVAVEKLKPKAKPPVLPESPKVEIPGTEPPAESTNKKEVKKAAKEKAEALEEAAEESFAQVAAMAETGDVQAQYILGIAYYTGMQVQMDEQAAITWWRRASLGGHPDAGAYIGLAYAEGFGNMTKSQEGADWNYLQAEQKDSALARVLLGIADYKTNDLTQKDKAVKRFQAAAQQGNPQAKTFLEVIAQRGTEAPIDFGKNLDWKKEAQKTPLTDLYTQAGTNAFWGRIVAQDYTVAVHWWELAAKQDHSLAQALLGTAYYTGRGVPQDEETAVVLFKTAAAKNEPLAQYMLGKAYLAGNVIQRNKELARQLFRAAGAAGIADAVRQAELLERGK